MWGAWSLETRLSCPGMQGFGVREPLAAGVCEARVSVELLHVEAEGDFSQSQGWGCYPEDTRGEE